MPMPRVESGPQKRPLVAKMHVPDEIHAEAAAHSSENELAALIMAMTTINAWNRIAIGSRTVAGLHKPVLHQSKHP